MSVGLDTQVESKRSFAVIHTWPDMKNAEYEVVQRIVKAGENIGSNVFVVDNDGYPLWASHRTVSKKSPRLTKADCEFLLSLHFESPKLIDVYSYVTLWNPPAFFDIFGYEAATHKLATHSNALSCDSEMADAHAANLFEGLGRPLALPLPRMFHSPAGPYMNPKITDNARLFYIGINWERISGQKGRHQDLLKQLDAAELIDIYGPTEFQGVRPWEDYKCYRGSLPFDGRSIISSINRAGICLAFSSKDHQQSGIMSNRLFEGLAAGAAIIANPHPIIDKYFRDCVYVVDDAKPADEIAHDVMEIVLGIREDPREALERVAIGQQRLEREFSLERSLEKLFALTESRELVDKDNKLSNKFCIDVLILYDGVDIAELHAMIEQVDKQKGVSVDVMILCDKRFADNNANEIRAKWQRLSSLRFVTLELYATRSAMNRQICRDGCLGSLVSKALKHVRSPTFCVMGAKETWFEDHLLLLSGALARDNDALMGLSGIISETRDAEGVWRRTVGELLFTEANRIVHGVGITGGAGRLLFKKDVLAFLPSYLLECLDGTELRAIALWAYVNGPIAQSASATYVYRSHAVLDVFERVAEHLQIKILLDSVRSNIKWRRLFESLPPLASQQLSPGDHFSLLEVNRPYLMQLDGIGCDLISSGFSWPEHDRIWIDGFEGILRFRIPDTHFVSHQTLVLTVSGRNARGTGEQQLCTILLNDEVALEDLPVGEDPKDVVVALGDHRSLTNGDRVTLSIKLRHAEKVYDRTGKILDARRLGLCVQSLRIEKQNRPTIAPTLHASSELQLVSGGSGANCVVSGCSLERDICWINGTNARLKFRIEPELDRGALLGLYVAARHSETGLPQTCSISLNGELIEESLTVKESADWIGISLGDCTSLRTDGINFIDVKVTGYANQVTDGNGVVVDGRRLGMSIDRLRLGREKPLGDKSTVSRQSDQETFPSIRGRLSHQHPPNDQFISLEVDRPYLMQTDGSGCDLIFSGFSRPERDRVWIDGLEGVLRFRIPDSHSLSQQSLILTVVARNARSSGDQQLCTVWLNDKIAAEEIPVGEEPQEILVTFDGDEGLEGGDRVILAIRLRHAETVVDRGGQILDPRHLGLCVKSLRIVLA